MSSGKFASLHSGLLARKGLATPAALPLPVVPALARPRYTDASPRAESSAPVPAESCCGGAARGAAEKTSAGAGGKRSAPTLHAVRNTNEQAAPDYDWQPKSGAEIRTHVSVRLNAEQLRRLKTAAAQLHVSQQKIMADGLEHYLDKLAVEELATCRCLKAKL